MLHKAWNCKGEMPYCFPRSSIKFQGHTGQNITDFDPNWAFPDYRPVAAFKSLRFALLLGDQSWPTTVHPFCHHGDVCAFLLPPLSDMWATDLLGDLCAIVLNMLKTSRRPWHPWRCLNVLCTILERPRQPFCLLSAFNGDLASFVVAQWRQKGRSPCVKGVLWLPGPSTHPTNDILLKFEIQWNFEMLLFKTYLADYNENFAHIMRVMLPWCVQNFIMISWAKFKSEYCKFWSNFEFDWITINGTSARSITMPQYLTSVLYDYKTVVWLLLGTLRLCH